jgi:hypothetical protein
MSITIKQYNSITETATEIESSEVVNVNTIQLISNDSTAGDLYISLENPISEDSNYLVVKSGESFRNLNIKTKKIYFKSSEGDVSFRFFGTKA